MAAGSDALTPNSVPHYLDRENVKERTFVFDPESLRANHRQVLVKATEGTDRYAFFVISLDEDRKSDEPSDAEDDGRSPAFRAYEAAPNTEVIVGALQEEPMRELVRRILRQDPKQGLSLEVATYTDQEAGG